MKTRSLKNKLLYSLILLFVMFSCKAPSTLITEKLKPVSTNRLIRNVENSAFDFKSFGIKRISCSYETPDEKASFRAELKLLKDSFILVSLSKLNVPVGRLLLTPDSIKMVNYFNKSYLLKDYSFLDRFTGADLDFYMVQSVLANDIFSYREDEKENDFKEFVSYADSGLYVLQSLKNRKLDKIFKKKKDEKVDRYLKKLNEEDLVVQYLYIDPLTYKIRKVFLDDKSNGKKLVIDFSDFQSIDNQLYPGDIAINFTGAERFLKIKLKLSKFSTAYDPSVNFRIPDKYKQIN